MKLIHVDYPLHVIQEVFATLLGRMALFLATYLAAFGAVFLVYEAAHLVWDSRLLLGRDLYVSRSLEGFLVTAFWLPVIGVLQGFGILAYAYLFHLLVSFVWLERPASRVLPPAFFLQTFEILRSSCQWVGWEGLLYPDTIACAILWGLGLAAYLALRRRKPPLS